MVKSQVEKELINCNCCRSDSHFPEGRIIFVSYFVMPKFYVKIDYFIQIVSNSGKCGEQSVVTLASLYLPCLIYYYTT